jgi:hypothetical protein
MRFVALPNRKSPALRGLIHSGYFKSKSHARESRDIPRLKAFCRIAPSVRLRVLAMLAALVFFFARVFKVRTLSGVHARRFVDFVAIKYNSNCDEGRSLRPKVLRTKVQNEQESHLLISHVLFWRKSPKGGRCAFAWSFTPTQ